MSVSYSVLVVDDEPDLRSMMIDLLTDEGYQVTGAESGEDALITLEKDPRYDLILLDVSMPGLSGMEVLVLIKSNPATRQIPVIMVTALDQISYKKQAYAAGADDFLPKPFELEELHLRVSTHIRLANALKAERELNQQVTAINEELKDFAYVISHDLKTPLRGISSLAMWIQEDLGDTVSDEVAENLRLLQKRVLKLNHMIDATLQYSRIGRFSEPKEEVQSEKLVDEVIEQLSPPDTINISKSGVFPLLYIEKNRLFQVFEHLIGNAVQYNDKPEGTIEIIGKSIPSGHCFEIKDDGAGIDPAYTGRIFQIFQSLGKQDNDDHIGIGLTLVKKIVEQFGGKIRVESEPGEGSSFFFTIPYPHLPVGGTDESSWPGGPMHRAERESRGIQDGR